MDQATEQVIAAINATKAVANVSSSAKGGGSGQPVATLTTSKYSSDPFQKPGPGASREENLQYGRGMGSLAHDFAVFYANQQIGGTIDRVNNRIPNGGRKTIWKNGLPVGKTDGYADIKRGNQIWEVKPVGADDRGWKQLKRYMDAGGYKAGTPIIPITKEFGFGTMTIWNSPDYPGVLLYEYKSNYSPQAEKYRVSALQPTVQPTYVEITPGMLVTGLVIIGVAVVAPHALPYIVPPAIQYGPTILGAGV